jgi:hypothetical protein
MWTGRQVLPILCKIRRFKMSQLNNVEYGQLDAQNGWLRNQKSPNG